MGLATDVHMTNKSVLYNYNYLVGGNLLYQRKLTILVQL
jgi:hypothetical protein